MHRASQRGGRSFGSSQFFYRRTSKPPVTTEVSRLNPIRLGIPAVGSNNYQMLCLSKFQIIKLLIRIISNAQLINHLKKAFVAVEILAE